MRRAHRHDMMVPKSVFPYKQWNYAKMSEPDSDLGPTELLREGFGLEPYFLLSG
jgi:hypothetical protein